MNRNGRARRSRVLVWAGMLLGLTGLAAVGLEWASCGHRLLAGGHSFSRRDLNAAVRWHPDATDHRHRPPHRRKAATTLASSAPVLFQPTGVGRLFIPLVIAAPVVLTAALPGMTQPAIQPAFPRGPPGTSREKGHPG